MKKRKFIFVSYTKNLIIADRNIMSPRAWGYLLPFLAIQVVSRVCQGCAVKFWKYAPLYISHWNLKRKRAFYDKQLQIFVPLTQSSSLSLQGHKAMNIISPWWSYILEIVTCTTGIATPLWLTASPSQVNVPTFTTMYHFVTMCPKVQDAK